MWWSWREIVPRLELWIGVTISSLLVMTRPSGSGDQTSKRAGCANVTPRSRSGTGVGQRDCDRGLVSLPAPHPDYLVGTAQLSAETSTPRSTWVRSIRRERGIGILLLAWAWFYSE